MRHERNVALKLLDPELGAERFLSEIRVTANLQHPNLLPLFDSGEVDGQLFYVMPYVEGESLRAHLEREKQLPVDEAVRIALSIDRTIDGRSDVYSLGAMLYEMLGGEAPHTGTTGQAIIAKLMTEGPRKVTALRRAVPAYVAAAVHRALEKLPADRWRSARTGSGHTRGGGGALGLALGVGVMMARRPTPAIATTLRFQFVTSDSEQFVAMTPAIPFAVSPDDRRVVYVGAAPSDRRLYERGLNDMQTRAPPGTDGVPLQPTYSPDGKSIAFGRH